MRRISISLATIALVFLPTLVRAQSPDNIHMDNPYIPKYTVGVGYDLIRSNAPPGTSSGFSANGGFATVAYAFRPWLSAAGEFSGTHANDIGVLGQNLTLTTFAFGPQVNSRHRSYTLFAQALFGAAHASDSYFPTATSYTTSASSYAIQGGGGIDFYLNDRFSLRLPSVQYLHTAYANGVNTSQNHFVIGAGVLVKFGGRFMYASSVHPAVKPHISFSCSASARTLQPGETLEVTTITRAEPQQDVDFVWTSDAGAISSNSSTATLDTTGLKPGKYKVVGHATLSQDSNTSSSCDVPFRVVAAPQAPPAPSPVIIHDAPPAVDDTEFHTHVRDVLFDYDKSNLRPDSTDPMAEAVRWLKVHPNLHVLIGGYSDERGTNEYNIALGLRRATTVRDALVNAGIPSDRLQIVSYGKGAQVCVAADEECFQRNRRAAFLVRP